MVNVSTWPVTVITDTTGVGDHVLEEVEEEEDVALVGEVASVVDAVGGERVVEVKGGSRVTETGVNVGC